MREFFVKVVIIALFAFLTVSCGEDSSVNDNESGADDDILTVDDEDQTADSDNEVPDDARFDPFIQALKDDLAKSKAYGVSVAIMENGKITFAAAFGSKDAEGEIPLTTETLMQIGSTTKQMTAAALLKKVENGDVSLDDSLETLLPDFDFKKDGTWDDAIKLRHILSHQGGFYDFTPWDDTPDDELLGYTAYGTFAKNYFVMNPPGVFWNYANPNFAFAGLVTEVLDTRFYPDIMREDIFLPLGMDRTYLRKKEVEKDGDYAVSYGYDFNDVESGNTVTIDLDKIADSAFTRPAGLVWTTPSQMMKWADFLMNGNKDVLSDELRKEITTAQVDTLYGAGTMKYGYGMFVESGYASKDGKWYEIPVWEHGGNTISFSNILYILPEQDFALAICSSAYATDFSNSVDAAITTLADLPEPSDNPPKYTVDPARFDDHIGTYEDPFNVGTLVITRDGDKLMVDAPDLDEYGLTVTPELTAVSSDIFVIYLDGTPYDITFIKADGNTKSTYIRQRAFVAKRSDGTTELKSFNMKKNIERWLKRSRIETGPLFFHH
ncbi:MAG TPA: serine hydrolase [bacterium]|mgnify:CR=1 FL=1|nr:serine hydrolase [bacterium]HPS28975.1 serine hydrolase [bacterium]